MANRECIDLWSEIKPESIKDDFEHGAIDNMRDIFKNNPYWEEVVRNFDSSNLWDVWITNGDKRKKTVGYKQLTSYPYDNYEFKIGDYITWNYGGVSTDWIIESLETHKIYNVNGKIWKCNNILKWIDENGNLQSYPCVIKDAISSPNPDEERSIVTFSGNIEVMVQLNDDTKLLKLVKRFIFGSQSLFDENQSYAYKLNANKSFSEGHLLKLYMSKDEVNETTDDISNSIADAFERIYSLDINQDNFEQIVGYTGQLNATVKLNNEVVSQPITWISSDDSIGTIDQSGNINLLSVGSVVFTATMTNNDNVLDSITIDVVAVPSGVIDVVFSPNVTQILQEDTISYNVVKTLDNINQSDTFSFSLSGASGSNYEFVDINGNDFTVKSLGFDSTLLTIMATSNIDASVGLIEIELKGLF